MKKELTKEDIYFFSRIKEIDAEPLLNIKEFLDAKKVHSVLIEYEWIERVKDLKKKKFPKKHIIEALMEKYDMSQSAIEIIIYNKQPSKSQGKACVRCEQSISISRFNRNNGVCDNCIKTEILKSKIDDGQD